MRHLIPNQRNSRRGNYTMMLAGLFPIFIGFSALSVDISYINMSRTQTQNVADAASHAAYVVYRSTGSEARGTAAANFILQENTIGNAVGTLDSVTYGEWDFDNRSFSQTGYINSAQAVVSRKDGNSLDLFFAPFLGFNQAQVSAKGVAAGRTRQIMLVTDVSCSFWRDIGSAKLASIAFLNYLRDNPLPGDRLGQAVFAGRKTFPLLHQLANPVHDHGSLLTEFSKLEICSRMPGALRGTPTSSSRCYTSQARGLHYAMQEFIRAGDSAEFQGVVLLTDGIANTYLTESVDNGWGRTAAEQDTELIRDFLWNGGTFSYNVWDCPLNQAGTSNCQIRNKSGSFEGGAHLWAVFFGTIDNRGRNWLNGLTSYHAGNQGKTIQTTNPNELVDIFVDIASSLPLVLTD